MQHIGNRWLRGICNPAVGAKIYAKLVLCMHAKIAKMSDFGNRNIFVHKFASWANLTFHPVHISPTKFILHAYIYYINPTLITFLVRYYLFTTLSLVMLRRLYFETDEIYASYLRIEDCAIEHNHKDATLKD